MGPIRISVAQMSVGKKVGTANGVWSYLIRRHTSIFQIGARFRRGAPLISIGGATVWPARRGASPAPGGDFWQDPRSLGRSEGLSERL
jgi:hypothetical protein